MIYDLKKSVLILHGWGLSGKVYSKLFELFKKEGYRVYAPDLPGFGSESLKKTMNLDDYVYFIYNFIKEHKLEKVILIGHSFGGRVAIKYAWKYPQNVSKLILTGVPIIRKKSFIKQIAYLVAVFGGKVFSVFPKKLKEFFRKTLYFVIGEWDYYKSGPLKEVFKNIIGEDLVSYVKEIKIPILLVWGENDGIVPVSDTKKIIEYMSNVKSVVVSNNGHKLPYENPVNFFEKILPFVK
ncbi:MAG: alpha/beta hydrolase [bacterium]|nr:alpha/beta hydrolase [bacterium]